MFGFEVDVFGFHVHRERECVCLCACVLAAGASGFLMRNFLSVLSSLGLKGFGLGVPCKMSRLLKLRVYLRIDRSQLLGFFSHRFFQ